MIRLLAALAVLLLPAAASAQDRVVGTTTTNQVVSAHGGRLVWSDGDRLMTWFRGTAAPVPVPPQAGGFDVDLGRGPDGRTVAVYSRDDGLYLFDFEAAAERRLDALSRPDAREQAPAISGTRITFFRGTARRRQLYRGRLGERSIRRVPGVPDDIGGYDLSGNYLAFTRRTMRGDVSTDRLYRHSLGGGVHDEVDRVSSGLLSSARFVGPTWAGTSRLYVAQVRLGAAGNRFKRYDVRRGREEEVPGRRNIAEASFTEGRAFYLRSATEFDEACGPCTLFLTEPLRF